jgi:AmpD protein
MKLDKTTGLIEPVRYIPSPNCDARPPAEPISLIVVHGISLPPGEYGGPWIDDLFVNRLDADAHPYFSEIAGLRVSSHFLIRRDGEITQYVPVIMRAWHAGESCYNGRSACNDFSVGIELEGDDNVPYEGVQYERLLELIEVLMQAYPTITADGIVGHVDIAPGRKTDPGLAFDWPNLRKKLATRLASLEDVDNT